MNDEKKEFLSQELMFTQLVLSFQAAAWQQMGKVPSMISGKIERDLEMAKHSIDMLGMLETKTKGNLTENENKYLQHVLYELRLNYLDEVKKGPDEQKSKPEDPPESPKTEPDKTEQDKQE
jgi:hypothetical protein